MMNATADNLSAAGSPQPAGVHAADSGYRTHDAVAALDPDGPTVLLAPGKEHETRRHAAQPPTREGSPPESATPAEQIDWHLETAWGKQTYARRAATVEPGFAPDQTQPPHHPLPPHRPGRRRLRMETHQPHRQHPPTVPPDPR